MSSGPHFLSVLVHDLSKDPSVTGLCAGYEQSEWRAKKLARKMIQAIPSFALTHSQYESFDGDTGVEMLGRAVHSVYATEKYHKRGEFGEILLHMALRQVFETVPAVSKIYFQDNDNHVVKGFDAVHVVADEKRLELWLGEVKFYEHLGKAITDVRAELHKHTEARYLEREFAAITAKIDPAWPHADRLKLLLHPDITLDEVFDNLTVPVLLTYNSEIVAARVAEMNEAGGPCKDTYDAYKNAFETEIRAGLEKFAKNLPADVRVRLILVPLHDKKTLLSELHARLTSMQRATE